MAQNFFSKTIDTLGGLFTGIGGNRKGKFNAVSLNTVRGGYASQMNIEKYGLRKPGRVTFRILRQIASRDAIIRICVNVIKKSVSQCERDIGVKKNAPGDRKKDYEKEKQMIFDLFEYMNMNGENMRILLDRVMEDVLVLDAGVIEIVRSMDGTQIVALNSIDGATIRPVYNAYGELSDDHAYYQLVNEAKVAEFTKEDIIYIMANPQNDVDTFGYGMSPIESILLQVQASLEADMFNIKHFTKDNVPPGILDLGDMTTEQAEEFIATWNATVIGNPHSMKFVWGSSEAKKFTPFNTSNKDMQYVEYINWLSKIKLSTYGLSTIDANILQDVNRSTSEVMAEISGSRGVRSAKKLIEEYFTRNIIRNMDSTNEKFKWLEFRFEEVEGVSAKLKQAQIDEIYLGTFVTTPDEIRERDGKAPLKATPLSDVLGVTIATQNKKDKEEKINIATDNRGREEKAKTNKKRPAYKKEDEDSLDGEPFTKSVY